MKRIILEMGMGNDLYGEEFMPSLVCWFRCFAVMNIALCKVAPVPPCRDATPVSYTHLKLPKNA